MDRKEKTILTFTGASHFFTHFYMLVFPALLLPISRDLGLPLAKAVNISFSMYLLYGLVAAGWGFLSDKWSHKGALSIGIGIAGMGMLLAGVSAFFNAPVPFLAASFALVGIGCSSFHPSGTALVSQGIRERGKALGINGIFGNIGIALAPVTAGVLNYFVGWQTGLIILGSIGVLLGIASSVAPIGIERGEDKLEVEKVERGSAIRLFIIFALAMTVSGLMYRTFTTMLPAFLEMRLGNFTKAIRESLGGAGGSAASNPALETLVANVVTTGVYVIGVVGQLIGGRIADRKSLKWSYFAFFFFALPFALGLVFLHSGWVVLSAGLFVLFVLGLQPIENSLVAYLTPAKWRSVSYGIKFSLVFGVGSLAVKLIAWVQGKTGSLDNVMWMIVLFLCLILVIFGVFLIVSRGKRIQHMKQK